MAVQLPVQVNQAAALAQVQRRIQAQELRGRSGVGMLTAGGQLRLNEFLHGPR